MKTRFHVAITFIILLWTLGITNSAWALPPTYYSKGVGLLASDINNWALNTNGTGGPPPDFISPAHYVIQAGHAMYLNASWTVNTSYEITVNGELDCQSYSVTGTSGFVLASGAKLTVASTSGIDGCITVSGTKSFSTSANYVFNATGAQVTGASLPTTINNLTLNNTSGVTLSGNITVTGTLTFVRGILANNAYTLTVGTVSGYSSSMYIDASYGGQYRQTVSATGSILLPIGDQTRYTPVTVNITAGSFSSAYIGAKVKPIKYGGNTSTTHYINRYWPITTSGITGLSYDATFTYVMGDVTGTESNLYGGWYNGSSWTLLSAVNIGTHSFSGTGFTGDLLAVTAGEQSALPVELSRFNATASSNAAMLNWSTATEINNYGFEVERRRIQRQEDRSQMAEWMKIGFVAGNGTSNSPHEYSFTDAGVISGSYTYRLKQIDNSGVFKYSQETAVIIRVPAGFALGQNFPNPFNPSTVINYSITSTSNVMLRVYNILGSEVATLVNENKSPGSYSVTFNASALANGVYFYRLNAGQLSDVKRLTVMK